MNRLLVVICIGCAWSNTTAADVVTEVASTCTIASMVAGTHEDARWWRRLTTTDQINKDWDEYKDLNLKSKPEELDLIHTVYTEAAVACNTMRSDTQ